MLTAFIILIQIELKWSELANVIAFSLLKWNKFNVNYAS